MILPMFFYGKDLFIHALSVMLLGSTKCIDWVAAEVLPMVLVFCRNQATKSPLRDVKVFLT